MHLISSSENCKSKTVIAFDIQIPLMHHVETVAEAETETERLDKSNKYTQHATVSWVEIFRLKQSYPHS